MKTSFKMVAMLLGMGIFPLCANAQKKVIIEDEEPNSIMFISRDKAGDEIIRIMNDRSQLRFHDPNAPRFLLTDQKGKFALGIGGYSRRPFFLGSFLSQFPYFQLIDISS